MSNIIINLTQHSATAEQFEAGVRDLVGPAAEEAKRLLTFDLPPSREEIEGRAEALAGLAAGLGAPAAMIGGAPFLMPALERALKTRRLRPVYAFSRRESVDQPQPDGSIRKVAVFRHAGWVEA